MTALPVLADPPDVAQLLLDHVRHGQRIDLPPLARAFALQRHGNSVTLEADIGTGAQKIYSGTAALVSLAGQMGEEEFAEPSVPVSLLAKLTLRHAAQELTLSDFGAVDRRRALLSFHHGRVSGYSVTVAAYDLRTPEAIISPASVDDTALAVHLTRLLIKDRHPRDAELVRSYAQQDGPESLHQLARAAYAVVPKNELALAGWATVVVPPDGAAPWVLSGVPRDASRSAYRRIKSEFRLLLAGEVHDSRTVSLSAFNDFAVAGGGGDWRLDVEAGRTGNTGGADDAVTGGPRSNTAPRPGWWRYEEDRWASSFDIRAAVRAALSAEPLTETEATVVVALFPHLRGWQVPRGSQDRVADLLGMSHASVRRHWTNARKKLQTGRLAELLEERLLLEEDRPLWTPLPGDQPRGDCPVCGGPILAGQVTIDGTHSACLDF